MAHLSETKQLFRGSIVSQQTVLPAEIAQRKAERKRSGLRCRKIFERLRPQLIKQHYNWFVAIEPETGEYLIDPQLLGIVQKIRDRYGQTDAMLTTFRLNESGTCGRL